MVSIDKRCLRFISIGNVFLNGSIEYDIRKSVIENLNRIDSLKIEEISEISNCSKATVSRFFKKYGFNSYKEFKMQMTKFLLIQKTRREHLPNINSDYFGTVVEKLEDNFQETKKYINYNILDEIDRLFSNSKKVILISQVAINEMLYAVQLNLIIRGIITLIYSIESLDDSVLKDTSEDDVVVIFSLSKDWFINEKKELLKKLTKKVKLVYFSQDKDDIGIERAEIKYLYGIPNSYHNGIISAFLLISFWANRIDSSLIDL